MKKKRNQARNHRSLQVITLCISTAMVLVLIGIVVLTVFTGRNLSNYVKENLTVTMVLQPDLTPSECAALCKKVQRFNYITNVEYTSKEQALKEGTKELGAVCRAWCGRNTKDLFPCSNEVLNYLRRDDLGQTKRKLV